MQGGSCTQLYTGKMIALAKAKLCQHPSWHGSITWGIKKKKSPIKLSAVSELVLVLCLEPFLTQAGSEQPLRGHSRKQIIFMYWKSVNTEKFITVIHKIVLCTSSPAAVVSCPCLNSQPLIDTYFSLRQNPKPEICALLEWMCLGIRPYF